MSKYDQKMLENIGQMLMLSFSGQKINEDIRHIIHEQKIGGVILFSNNISDPKQLQTLCQDLQQFNQKHGSPYPLFISIDQEGGAISRIPWLKEQYNDPILLKDRPKGAAFQFGYGLGQELSKLGININFAPVLDILSNQDNTLLCKRCLGTETQKVAILGEKVILGLHQGGVLATGKHFPGHGDVTLDSHFHLPISGCDIETLKKREFFPFLQAIHAGLEIIMTAHVKYTHLDPIYPATLSEKILQQILRKQINYQGLIISDDLLMKAVTNHYSLEEAALLAVKAGIDILLICHDLQQERSVWKTLIDNYQNPLFQKLIDLAGQRVLHLKEKRHKILAFH